MTRSGAGDRSRRCRVDRDGRCVRGDNGLRAHRAGEALEDLALDRFVFSDRLDRELRAGRFLGRLAAADPRERGRSRASALSLPLADCFLELGADPRQPFFDERRVLIDQHHLQAGLGCDLRDALRPSALRLRLPASSMSTELLLYCQPESAGRARCRHTLRAVKVSGCAGYAPEHGCSARPSRRARSRVERPRRGPHVSPPGAGRSSSQGAAQRERDHPSRARSNRSSANGTAELDARAGRGRAAARGRVLPAARRGRSARA